MSSWDLFIKYTKVVKPNSKWYVGDATKPRVADPLRANRLTFVILIASSNLLQRFRHERHRFGEVPPS
jgi:hypothetical protein